MQSTVLVLGALGRFGQAAARAFADAGWRVLGQVRPGAVPPQDACIEWLGVDLDDVQAVVAAARGATVVVHGLSPAYTHGAWRAQVLPLMDAAIEITRVLDATLMVPGNVYNFGEGMPDLLREDTPQLARTVKGEIRIAMENRLQQARVRGVIIRAGDFFGSGRGTWFDAAIVKGIRKGIFAYPGPRDVVTAWAYLPDLARTFVAVAQRRAQLQNFEVFHFAGHPISAQQWLEVLDPVARTHGWVQSGSHLKLRSLPWPLIRLFATLVPTWAALLEMRYLWRSPYALANDKLTTLIGAEPHTPLEKAATRALVDLGMLPTSRQSPNPVPAR